MTENAGKIFQGAAWYYARYRAPYQKQQLEDLKSFFHLDGKGILLDLGCGTGELTVPLAPYFEKAIGLDPSSDMLAEAQERQQREGASNIQWIQGIAEELDTLNAEFHVTTIGTAFHWMQQDVVLKKVYEQTEPGGGVAVLFGSLSKWWEAHAPWQQKAKEIVQKYLGPNRRAGEGYFKTYRQGNGKSEDALGNSAFKEIKSYVYQTSLTLSSEQILGRLYSSSWANKRYFADRAFEFENELKEELLALEPRDTFLEEGTAESYFALKL